MKKHLVVILVVGILATSLISFADAHPHNSIDLMNTHSHDIHDVDFMEHFFIHTYEQVVISLTDLLSFLP